MHIKNLKYIPNTRTLTWRTVEGDKGMYLTYANGRGILYQRDDNRFGHKVATHEKFSVCKTVHGTRQKLTRIFADIEDDPTPEKPWKL